MEAQKDFDGFDLDHDQIIDKEVEAIASIQAKPLVFDSHRDLPTHGQSPKPKLLLQARFVDCLEQTRTQRAMDLQPSVDDRPSNRVCGRSDLLVCLVVHFLL